MPVDRVTLAEATETASQWITDGGSPRLGLAVNAGKAESMRRDATLRAVAARADLLFADGVGVVWASRILGDPLPERVPGVELCGALLERASERGWRPYLLGAHQDVLQQLASQLTERGIDLAGMHDGYWSTLSEQDLVAEISSARPDVLFVALGSPRQEAFLLRWLDTLDVPFAMGVGGSFDVLSGQKQRAPKLFRSSGLEWAWRLGREPRRLATRRALDLPLWAGRVTLEKISSYTSF